jgi:WD40 repeat protein
LANSTGYAIKLWDIQGAKHTQYVHSISTDVNTDIIALSPNGKFIASNGADGTIYIWDVKSGQQIMKLSGHPFSRWTGEQPGYVYELTFNSNSTLLASAGSDGYVRLWQISDGKMLAELMYMDASKLIFSPDGSLLAISGGESILCMNNECSPAHTEIGIWNVSDQSLLRVFDLSGSNITFHPNTTNLASVNKALGTVQVFDVNTGIISKTWQAPMGCTDAFFSADGKYLIMIREKTVEYWDWNTGRLLAKKDFSYSILQANFSPDNKLLVLAYTNGIIETWEIMPE